MAEAKTETAVKAKKVGATSKLADAAKVVTKKAPVAKAEKSDAPKAKAATTAKKPAAAKSRMNVTPEQRYSMICEAAYFKAECRGFAPENEVQDWLDAEAEINRLLGM